MPSSAPKSYDTRARIKKLLSRRDVNCIETEPAVDVSMLVENQYMFNRMISKLVGNSEE